MDESENNVRMKVRVWGPALVWLVSAVGLLADLLTLVGLTGRASTIGRISLVVVLAASTLYLLWTLHIELLLANSRLKRCLKLARNELLSFLETNNGKAIAGQVDSTRVGMECHAQRLCRIKGVANVERKIPLEGETVQRLRILLPIGYSHGVRAGMLVDIYSFRQDSPIHSETVEEAQAPGLGSWVEPNETRIIIREDASWGLTDRDIHRGRLRAQIRIPTSEDDFCVNTLLGNLQFDMRTPSQ